MGDGPDPSKPARPAAKSERQRRLAEALRANLARRKAQKRARQDDARGNEQRG